MTFGPKSIYIFNAENRNRWDDNRIRSYTTGTSAEHPSSSVLTGRERWKDRDVRYVVTVPVT
jgi:hypothetical protein